MRVSLAFSVSLVCCGNLFCICFERCLLLSADVLFSKLFPPRCFIVKDEYAFLSSVVCIIMHICLCLLRVCGAFDASRVPSVSSSLMSDVFVAYFMVLCNSLINSDL